MSLNRGQRSTIPASTFQLSKEAALFGGAGAFDFYVNQKFTYGNANANANAKTNTNIKAKRK